MSQLSKLKLIPILAIFFSVVMGTFSPTTYAEKEDLSEASLYFDTEDCFPYIYQSDNFINYSLSPIGKSKSGLRIAGDYVSSEGTSSAVLFFNSSSFGLDSFNGCTILVDSMLDKGLPPDQVNVKLYSDGVQLKAVPMTSSEGWLNYSLDIGDCSNNIAGVYVQFKAPYTGAVCTIDNFTVIKPDGTIAKIEGINDEVKSSNIPPVLKIVAIIVVILILAGASYLIIKESFFKFY